MLTTEEYSNIIIALGGDPESLPDKTEKTLVNTIFDLIAGRIPTSAEVKDAIHDMTSTQKNSVKTDLSIPEAVSATNVLTSIQGMTTEQKAAVKTALGIS